MKKIKLILDKSCCLGCSACVPEAWEEATDTWYFDEPKKYDVHISGKPKLVGENEELVLEVTESQLQCLQDAIHVCPVEAITVEELTV